MLSVATEINVRPVITAAVRISRPDVRRRVSARQAMAPYDQPRATNIAVHTSVTRKQR